MATYAYSVPNVDLGLLQTQCLAAGLPVAGVNGGAIGSGDVYVITSVDLTAQQKTTLDAVVSAHDGRPRRKRRLYDVFQAIGALSNSQKLAISSDLFSGTPPKFALDEGDDSPDLLVLYVLQLTGGLSTADKNLVKQAAASVYARDNPTYLVHPSFDPTINVPGEEPVG
jgi:hypothetical protein